MCAIYSYIYRSFNQTTTQHNRIPGVDSERVFGECFVVNL